MHIFSNDLFLPFVVVAPLHNGIRITVVFIIFPDCIEPKRTQLQINIVQARQSILLPDLWGYKRRFINRLQIRNPIKVIKFQTVRS